jgi:hypothetical protein
MNRPQAIKILILVLISLAFLSGAAYYLLGYGGNGNDNPNPNFNPSPTPILTLTPTPTEEMITITPTMIVSGQVTLTPTLTTSPTPAFATVKVFFSKNPESNNDFNFTVPVTRSTNRVDVGAYSLEQLLAGPSVAEQGTGLFTPLKVSGSSNCGSKEFTLTIDSAKKATLKFCKTVESSGVGVDARITKSVNDTLKQFPSITKVVILTKDDNCFGDQSGQNLCKN